MMNEFVSKASDIVTTHDSQRSGFLEYALRKSKESIPYIDKARALKLILEQKTKKPIDILKLDVIRNSCYEAAGVSVKAKSFLSVSDLDEILSEFIREYLEPSGQKYVDELIYRYLLTSGDALGGKMRNLTGSMANEKLTRYIISQLQVLNLSFRFYNKTSKKWIDSTSYSIDEVVHIRAIQWKLKTGEERQIIYNLTVPIVKKNIDLVVLKEHSKSLTDDKFKQLIQKPKKYVLIGELKGGIDPAGADEHWKTARTALLRGRESFSRYKIKIPIVFIGAAIEKSMAEEIFEQYTKGTITNCANLTIDNQLLSLCNWLVTL